MKAWQYDHLVNRIDELQTRVGELEAWFDGADVRRAKFNSLMLTYIENAVDGGMIPVNVANEFIEFIENINRVDSGD